MTRPPVSLVIVNDAYLSRGHLTYCIAALNQQSDPGFNVFWINQQSAQGDLGRALPAAGFPYFIAQPAYPFLQGVCCWELPLVLSQLLLHPQMGDYLVYLHKECLLDPCFIASLRAGLAAAEAAHGRDNIYILNQLRSPLTVDDLAGPEAFQDQLCQAGAQTWATRERFTPKNFLFRPESWQEDAFCAPTALLRQLRLYSCLQVPLFFQDIFDILYQLPDKPYASHIQWLRLGLPVIHHLNHPRYFHEYSPGFMRQIRSHPQLFGHLALYDLPESDLPYQEPFVAGERQINSGAASRLMHFLKYSPQGTMTLWNQALDRAHGWSG